MPGLLLRETGIYDVGFLYVIFTKPHPITGYTQNYLMFVEKEMRFANAFSK